MCASFGSTRLMCASFGSTRLMCASFGSTRLICAFYGTTRLLCRVRAQRGADRREAGRTREGHMDASGFLIASAIDLSLVRKVGSLHLLSATRAASLPVELHAHRACIASRAARLHQFVLGVPSGHRRPDFVPTGAHVARVRERASYWVGAEVRARASWRATGSDRGEP
ncbi:hypothetical protein E6C27_scaffold261G00070 [Cucumis melo var. makuwa]|uniref:DNA-directed RNA polymerase I subunit RPA1-like n=1 Tax=Cucumis melo var. makuwa TaxID=1194695 RepID=A0A5A7SW53_CUCMM|nr:hypothetical protein E6C27_scaffold261G00070 [Cucumis melo var. makuwa]